MVDAGYLPTTTLRHEQPYVQASLNDQNGPEAVRPVLVRTRENADIQSDGVRSLELTPYPEAQCPHQEDALSGGNLTSGHFAANRETLTHLEGFERRQISLAKYRAIRTEWRRNGTRIQPYQMISASIPARAPPTSGFLATTESMSGQGAALEGS